MENKLNFCTLLILLLIGILATSCSDPEEGLKKTEMLWERQITRGCLNKGAFGFGPEAEYNVYLGDHLDRLFYSKYESIGSESTSYVIENNTNSYTVDYGFENLVEDQKNNNLYLLQRNFRTLSLYEVNAETFQKGEAIFEDTDALFGKSYKIFNSKIYTIEKIENTYTLFENNLNLSSKSQLHAFEIPFGKKVGFESIYQWDDKVYVNFKVYNESAPYDDNSVLIQMDLEKAEVLWTKYIPSLQSSNYFIGDEMYVLMNNEESLVLNVKTGEELRIIPVLGNQFSFSFINDEIILIRDREYEDGYPITEWLRAYDLITLDEIFAIEGLYLGMYNDKVYSIDKGSTLNIASLTDLSFRSTINLKDLFEDDNSYSHWEMREGSNLLLGQRNTCNISYLVCIHLE